MFFLTVSIAVEDIEKKGIMEEGSIVLDYVDTQCEGVNGLGKD